METIPSEPAHLTGLYVRNFLANFAGNCIIVMLNIFTPLAVYENWKAFIWQGGLIGGWIILFGAGTNAPLVLLVDTIGFTAWEIQDYAISAGQFGKMVFAFAVAVYILFT